MPYGLVVALALLWMATRTHASDLVFLYPTITFPRNITMGLGSFVNFRCELNISAGSANEMVWLHEGTRIIDNGRRHSSLEVPSEGRYISHLELRELEDIDAGRYTCDAKVRLDNLNLVQVVPDSVYLSVADYKKAHWSQPCLQLQTMKTCVDANTACLRDQPPSRTTPTGWSCQCLDQFPIYISALGRCGKVVPEGRDCTMDWECERSGMVCIERSCRHKVAVSGGQIAVLTLLSIIGACLLFYLVILLLRRFSEQKRLLPMDIAITSLGRGNDSGDTTASAAASRCAIVVRVVVRRLLQRDTASATVGVKRAVRKFLRQLGYSLRVLKTVVFLGDLRRKNFGLSVCTFICFFRPKQYPKGHQSGQTILQTTNPIHSAHQ
ncbi:uncharacterized protein LOC119174053 isoform X5 [Rhipicephalus microplus]|uniref:uncharacterized protein LOC119174053 isoform X5 n=1 Tax=Rhipicephalus microplus TaxID=6941 RepID=UPI003F6B7C5B